MKKESLSASMPKLIMAVSLIVCISAVLGILGHYLTSPKKEVAINGGIKKEEINKDEMADWQTYRNEEYGFEFKYSNNWQTTGYHPQLRRMVFMINHENSKIISQINFNILDYSEYYSLHGHSQHKIPDENIKINGNNAEVYKYDNKYETTFINSGQYVFDYQELNQDNSKILKKNWIYFDDYNRVLSTFKFVEK